MIQDFLQQLFYSSDAVMAIAWAAFIPAALNLVSSGVGAINEGKKRRQMNQRLNEMKDENQAFFNQDYYGDYTQRADAQNVIRQMRDALKEQSKRDEGSAVVTGATIESQAANKEARNKAMSNLFGNLGAMGEQFKERAKNRYLARKSALEGMEYDNILQDAQSSGNLLQNGLQGLASTDWASILGGLGSTAGATSAIGNITKPGVKPLNVNPIKDVSGIKITNPLK